MGHSSSGTWYIEVAQWLSSRDLKTFRDGAVTTDVGRLFQSLTVLMPKKLRLALETALGLTIFQG